MSPIDELLAIDSKNASIWRANASHFDRSLPEVFDTAAEMFRTFARCMEGQIYDADEFTALDSYAKSNGLTAEQLLERISMGGVCGSDPLRPAQETYFRIRGRKARLIILLLLERHFLWSVTDLLRLRLTSAGGYCRLEAESIGLLLLIQEDPFLGHLWWNIVSETEGRRFFDLTQPKLKKRLSQVDLASAYEKGSAAAQHVRLLSAVEGLSWSDTRATLNCTEAREEDPFLFFLNVLSFLSTQVRIFCLLKSAFPEVTDPIWDERVRFFNNDVARLWKVLETKFPIRCKEMQDLDDKLSK